MAQRPNNNDINELQRRAGQLLDDTGNTLDKLKGLGEEYRQARNHLYKSRKSDPTSEVLHELCQIR